MADIEKLERIVRERYEKKNPNRDRWSDWMFENHVIDVADRAEVLAHRFKASPAACKASALLHDIADAEIPRQDPNTDKVNMEVAAMLLHQAQFSDSEKQDILADALPFHSCHGEERPKTMVGKILATADALSHLNTEFYGYFNGVLASERTPEQSRQIARSKLLRDFNTKIAFDEVREEVRERYEELLSKYG